MFRVDESKVNGLPKIPAQVIGYGLAIELFKLIEPNQNEVKDSWAGIMGVNYTYGGKMINEQYA